jgi:site-specific DNA recombinase
MQVDTSSIKYIAYARKSTDRDDQQVNSLDDQVDEIAKMGRDLNVVRTIQESQSAKKPGRPKFAEMMELIAQGKVQGIVSWKLNRLARNPVDGGLIIWQLQQGIIKHVRTSDGDYYPESDMLMLYIHFGMANQFSLNLSKDVTRGMLSKARSGRRPGSAPLGYLNSKVNNKGDQDILPDPVRGPIIRKMIDCILAGTHNAPQALVLGTEEWGLRTRETIKYPRGRKLTNSGWYSLLQNPFYYGRFQYPIGNKHAKERQMEWIQGIHKPLVSFEEFQTLKKILSKSGVKRTKQKFAYMGLMRCAGCGARITCEKKIKRQLNGNVHEYSYYL